MGKQSFQTAIRLFLKFMLLFQIYSHHCFKAEATENRFPESSDKAKVVEETGLNDQIFDEDAGSSVIERPKRPARLLPLRMTLEKERNQTERFYGPATSCEELLKIGYTRNGFYLVKGRNATSNSRVEMFDCLFENSIGIKVTEKRLGFLPLNASLRKKSHHHRSIDTLTEISLETNTGEINNERSKRPGRLLPLQLLNGREEENIRKQFYGPPSNCTELGELGYRLNGYYLVNGSPSRRRIEMVFCWFKLPRGYNESAMEERLGLISLEKLHHFYKKSNTKKSGFNSIGGRKRKPARMIPLNLLFNWKDKNKTAEPIVQRFNSNPTNCIDMGKLGYTLNGFYIVNGSNSAERFEVLFCQFKLPPEEEYKTIKEEGFGVIRLLNCKEEAMAGTCKSDPVYMSLLCDKSFCNGNRSPSIGYRIIVNGFRKGMAPYYDSRDDGSILLQTRMTAMLWSWNEASVGSGERHLCNQYKFCATSSRKDPSNPNETHIKQKNYTDKEGQRFDFLDLPAYPGFFLIKDEFETCIGINENTVVYAASVRAVDCNPTEAGQRWKWRFP